LKTIASFKHKDIELKDVIFIDNLWDIDYGRIQSDWWVVFHDDEWIEERLLSAILVGGKCENFDAFSFYKADAKRRITYCPRMFRKHVRLEPDCLYPMMPVRIESLLDGWVFEHDSNEDRSKTLANNDLFVGRDEESVHGGIKEHDSQLCQGTSNAPDSQHHDREV